MNIIFDKIKSMHIGVGDNVSISCRNGKTYENCMIKDVPKSQDEYSIQVELPSKLSGLSILNIPLNEIKIIRRVVY